MTKAQIAKAAAEIEKLGPPPSWSNFDELKDFSYTTPGLQGTHKKKLNFEQAVDLYKALDDEVAQREALKKDIREALQAAVMLTGEKSVTAGDYVPMLVERAGSKKIVAEKLLAKGVAAIVIAECTEIGKGSTFLQIKRAKEL